jgi:hypothetical protein
MNGEAGWFDRTFAKTNIVILVIFSLCCQPIPLALGIAGMVICTDPKAKSNSTTVVIISALVIGLGVILNFLNILGRLMVGR